MDHTGQAHVLREHRRPVALGLAVDLRHMFADIDIAIRGLGHRLLRDRQLCRILHQFAELGRLTASANDTVGDGDRARFDAPTLCRRRDQHRARRGARHPHLVPAFAHRGRSADAHRAEHQILVERVIGRGEDHRDLIPGGVQFIGDDRRHARCRSLAELDMFGDDRHAAVAADAYERIGGERRGGRLCLCRLARQCDPDGERGASGQEGATIGERVHAFAPFTPAASLIA